MSKCLVFTGGGTAGHVYPGLSVIEKIREKNPGIRFVWIGSSRGMEKDIVLNAGVEFLGIPSGKLRRYFSLRNFTDIFKIGAGFLKALTLLSRLKPDLVFSKGGFVSVPPVAAAGFLKIQVVSHESDVSPGLATRINTRFSSSVLVSYRKTLSAFADGKAVLTGNPVRDAVFRGNGSRGRELLKAGDRKIIMVIGGSQGALQINRLIEEILPKTNGRWVIVHQSGKHPYLKECPEYYHRFEYINEELPDLMASADLIISRAGASTIWEAAALGRPMLLIPLGTGASRGDQALNADVFNEAGAAEVMEGEITPGMLKNQIERLMNDDTIREKMSRAAFSMVNGNPADSIADFILERLS